MDTYKGEIKRLLVDKSHNKWMEVTPEAMYSPFLIKVQTDIYE